MFRPRQCCCPRALRRRTTTRSTSWQAQLVQPPLWPCAAETSPCQDQACRPLTIGAADGKHWDGVLCAQAARGKLCAALGPSQSQPAPWIGALQPSADRASWWRGLKPGVTGFVNVQGLGLAWLRTLDQVKRVFGALGRQEARSSSGSPGSPAVFSALTGCDALPRCVLFGGRSWSFSAVARVSPANRCRAKRGSRAVWLARKFSGRVRHREPRPSHPAAAVA